MEEEPIHGPKTIHELGSDLSLLSVGELRERVAALKEEIARLEAVIRSKESSKDAADTFFKRLIGARARGSSSATGKINHLLRFPAHYRMVQLLDASGSCPLCLTPPCENSKSRFIAALFLCPGPARTARRAICKQFGSPRKAGQGGFTSRPCSSNQ